MPPLLKIYAIDEPIPEVISCVFVHTDSVFDWRFQVRATLKRQFLKYGKDPLEEPVANMLLFKGQVQDDLCFCWVDAKD